MQDLNMHICEVLNLIIKLLSKYVICKISDDMHDHAHYLACTVNIMAS